jgi:hypothetical protein
MKRFPSNILRGLAGVGLAGTLACGAGDESSPDTTIDTPSPVLAAGGSSPASAKQNACPLALAGTTSTVENTVDGVVVMFSTKRPASMPELRRRVEALADAHNSMRAGPGEDLSTAPPQAPGPTTTPEGAEAANDAKAAPSGGKIASKATAESSEEGVRLVLRPRDPAQVDSVRDQLRKQADDLVQGVCDQAGRKSLR